LMPHFVIDWILPVIIGAAIGYITNDIAIKMLFRPLAEKRLFGIRIPLTPGIIPKNRHKLAVSLGKTVSDELLNVDVLSRRFKEEDFKRAVGKSVDSLVSGLLDTRLESLGFSSGTDAYGKVLSVVSRVLDAVLGSEDFDGILAGLVGRALDGIGNMRVAELLGDSAPDVLARRAVDALLEAGGAEKLRVKAGEALSRWFEGVRPAADFLPFDAADMASRAVSALYPEALRIFLDFLRTAGMRGELVVNGREIVSNLLRRLNPFQRLVVAAARYEQAINDNMEATVADLITHLELSAAKTEVRDLLALSAAKAAAEWASLPPENVLKRLPDASERMLRLVDSVFSSLEGESGRANLARALAGILEGIKDRRIMDIAEKGLGLTRERIEALVLGAASRALKGGGNEAFAAWITSFASSFIEARKDKSVGEVFKIDEGFRKELSKALAEKAMGLIESKVGAIVETVDVRRTVEEKIDSLDMLAVEKIILDVMKEQFTWINVFGAILGGLIGLVQAAVGRIL
jgi:uncharacterized membrane-anchored protein YjiN (DUF445 family)